MSNKINVIISPGTTRTCTYRSEAQACGAHPAERGEQPQPLCVHHPAGAGSAGPQRRGGARGQGQGDLLPAVPGGPGRLREDLPHQQCRGQAEGGRSVHARMHAGITYVRTCTVCSKLTKSCSHFYQI